MFSVNSILAERSHTLGLVPVRVLEETECTPRPFNEVTTYRGVVRIKGANKVWQSIQQLAAVGSHYHP